MRAKETYYPLVLFSEKCGHLLMAGIIKIRISLFLINDLF
jgi:hypothetical protein